VKIRKHIQYYLLNNFDLRSDIENESIINAQVLFLGKVEDKWKIAIDNSDIVYEYDSEYEYNEDVKIIIDSK
jgi:hypothetical protein